MTASRNGKKKVPEIKGGRHFDSAYRKANRPQELKQYHGREFKAMGN